MSSTYVFIFQNVVALQKQNSHSNSIVICLFSSFKTWLPTESNQVANIIHPSGPVMINLKESRVINLVLGFLEASAKVPLTICNE